MDNYHPYNTGGFVPPQNIGWSGTSYPPQPQPRLITNKSYVTSLEEALLKTTERNSDMIHFNQDKNEFYCVKVDLEGRKTWAVFTYNIPDQEENTPATKADIAELVKRIEDLERASNKAPTGKKKEVTDGKSNG